MADDVMNQTALPRQTRDSFDPAAVRAMLLRGDDPPQGWVSLMDEALHRICRLEQQVTAPHLDPVDNGLVNP